MESEALNITAWQLKHLAQALTRAKRLEALRTSFHKELYECISYSTTNFDPLNPKGIKTATDSQAIAIIEAKERYDRLIMNEYDRYFRWKLMLDWVNETDRIILVRYFQKKKYMRPERIKSLLNRIKEKVNVEERYLEKVRTDQSKEAYEEFLKVKAEKRLPKRKLSIFEDGKWILVDPDEYQMLQWRKRNEQQDEEWRQYLREKYKQQNAL